MTILLGIILLVILGFYYLCLKDVVELVKVGIWPLFVELFRFLRNPEWSDISRRDVYFSSAALLVCFAVHIIVPPEYSTDERAAQRNARPPQLNRADALQLSLIRSPGVAIASARRQYASAYEQQAAIVAQVEAEEIGRYGKADRTTAGQLGILADFALRARKFNEALAASERALELAPEFLWIEANRAHALLFLGRTEEARAIYLAHRGKRTSQKNGRTWEQVVRNDFTAMRFAGLNNEAFDDILAALNGG